MKRTRSEITREAYDAFANRELERLLQYASEDIEVRTVTGAVAGHEEPYRGHEGLAEYIRDAERIWDEIDLQAHEFIDLDDSRVLVLGRVRTRRGKARTDLPSAWLWEFDNDRVRRMSILTDATMIQRLELQRSDNDNG